VRITEALKILHAAGKTSKPFPVTLACGFTPLHLCTFLGAHMQQRLPGRRVEISSGLYGDVAGTLESLTHTNSDAIALVIEWGDLDPRLGFRSSGAWGAAAVSDILSALPAVLQRIKAGVERIPRAIPVAVCMPTLPLPPLFHAPGFEASGAELALDDMLAAFASELQALPSVRLVNARRLAEESAPAQRFDLKSDLLTGLPYTLSHADAAGSALTQLLLPASPKKGLITDLDDTLWSGLVGEIGADNISWDLASHTALHGVYQKLLAAFAEEGVLVAVASKNDAAVVQQAFQREDMLIPASSLFPMEVHWEAKSGSVARILQSWNISAESVVFVDDSPLELAEVAAAHPGVECIQFGGYEMLRRLRDLFGKSSVSAEDALRASSIRRASDFQTGGSSEDFLKSLNAVVSFDFPEEPDGRSLELVNKTNQFNLNGIRYSEAEWAKKLLLNDSIFIAVSYEDKFGPLGKIAVLQGQQKGRWLHLDVWVQSCRAFARRIEHQCLRLLFDRYAVDAIELSFTRTAKNGPVADFLHSFSAADRLLTREQFQQYCPPLYHAVKDTRRVEVNG
jgi:FkbH-like protein